MQYLVVQPKTCEHVVMWYILIHKMVLIKLSKKERIEFFILLKKASKQFGGMRFLSGIYYHWQSEGLSVMKKIHISAVKMT